MRFLARGLSAAVLLLVPSTAAPTFAAQQDIRPAPAPLYHSARAVQGQFIVTLRSDRDPARMAGQIGVKPRFTYGSVMRGFAATLNPTQVDAVRRTPGVQSVEENATVTAFGAGDRTTAGSTTTGRTTRDRTAGDPTTGEPSQRAAPESWGMDRVDQHALPLDNRFGTVGTGLGATAYIMDTGIDYAHSEFGGRAVPGYDAIGDGGNGQDCQGHGTHVAGTVGGATYGLAPKATLVSVRVLGCDGTGDWAGVLAGFDWVATHARQPAVLNASLGGPHSEAINQAADALSDSGVLPVVAAGNSSEDACGTSPASAGRVVTIGATDRGDRTASFSNYGRCLSMFAPGTDIVSARLGGGSTSLDGTSMASPHAAGVALLYKAAHPTASPHSVAAWLADASTKRVLTVTPDSPNRLLFTGGL